jgi:broad specificity phosphatase PhoE
MSHSTLLDYLRHGQPEGGNKYRGSRIDDPLSELGWQQMRSTVAELEGWTRILTSPMQRCRAFAEWLGGERGIPVEVIDDLREVGFGSWEGATRAELLEQQADEYHAFYVDPVNNRPAGAEPLQAFGGRVADVFETAAARYPGEHLLLVAHAGVIRATLGHVTRAPAISWYRAAVDNAALSRFAHDGRRARLLVHNWRPALGSG